VYLQLKFRQSERDFIMLKDEYVERERDVKMERRQGEGEEEGKCEYEERKRGELKFRKSCKVEERGRKIKIKRV
jgi:hypothetical protein